MIRSSSARPVVHALILGLVVGGPLVAQDSASAARKQQSGEAQVAATIEKFKQKDPDLQRQFAEAAGYAVFPTVGKGAIGIGGARGKGYVYEHGKLIGRTTLTQLSIGLQAGGQAYSEVIFFKTDAALANFKNGKLKLDAQASAVALTERVAQDIKYRDDVAIVTMAQGGLMYEASVGGQKFSFQPIGHKS